MEKVHNVVAWYQKKIGAYDKQFWEQSVEKKLQKGQQNVHHGHVSKKIVRLKTEFIDVDLIRGSTFSKSKPQVPWIYITRKTVIRLVFLPLCFKWWVQQTSWKFYFLLLLVYFMQVTSLCIYVKNVGIVKGIEDEVSLTEVMMPMTLMMVLGLIHSQTMMSHYSHKQLYRDGKLNRRYQKSKKQGDSSSATGSGRRDAEPSKSRESQSQKTKANRQRNINVTSTEELDQEKCGPSTSNNKGISCEKKKSESSTSVSNGNKPQNRGKDKWLNTDDKQTRNGDRSNKGKENSSCCNQRQTNENSSDVLASEVCGSRQERPTNMESSDVLGSEVYESHLQRQTNMFGKDVLDSEVTNKDNGPKNSSVSSVACGEAKLDSVGVDCSDDDTNSGKFEVLSVDQTHLLPGQNKADPSDKDASHLVLPKHTTGEMTITVGLSVGSHDDVIIETNPAWKSLMCYKKRLLEEDNFADTERASDECPSDVEPELGSFHGSSSNECKKTFIENCAKKQNVSEKIDRFSKLPECSNNVFNAEIEMELKVPDKRSVADQERPLSLSGTSLRRRRRVSASRSADIGEVARSRNVPNSLGLRQQVFSSLKQSSSENETTPTSPDKDNKVSSEEWEDRIHSDVTTSSSYSSSCASAEASDSGEGDPFREHKPAWTASSFHVINLLQPPTASNTGVAAVNPPDEVSCVIWEGNECRKVDLTAFDIGWAIIDKVDNIPESSDYVLIGIIFTIIMGCFPIIFRAYNLKDLPVIWSMEGLLSAWQMIQLNPWRRNFLTINAIFQRVCLSLIFFFLLSVADRTFKQRLLYAKHFCYLTSSRRARKFDMPHFRLNKVRNIKIWLSLRSYLKRRGPQRSVDIIVSATFLVAVSLVTLMCLQMLKDTDAYLDYMCNWEIVIWCLALGTYLLRFMTLGLKINKKYRSLSVLITEQINLYLQMEQKPHKKEELMLANNVLKLAEELLKELESPFKISGFSANPFIYNVTKVVVLSAFSAVLTELLGFKLKLYKIKFKT